MCFPLPHKGGGDNSSLLARCAARKRARVLLPPTQRGLRVLNPPTPAKRRFLRTPFYSEEQTNGWGEMYPPKRRGFSTKRRYKRSHGETLNPREFPPPKGFRPNLETREINPGLTSGKKWGSTQKRNLSSGEKTRGGLNPKPFQTEETTSVFPNQIRSELTWVGQQRANLSKRFPLSFNPGENLP